MVAPFWVGAACRSTLNNFHLSELKAVLRADPIPNPAVKRSLADGGACIACARAGCRQIISKKPERPKLFRLF
jgi:hypothetical protein